MPGPDTRSRPAVVTPAEATVARTGAAAAFLADSATRAVIRGYVRTAAIAAGLPNPSDARCDTLALTMFVDVLGPVAELP